MPRTKDLLDIDKISILVSATFVPSRSTMFDDGADWVGNVASTTTNHSSADTMFVRGDLICGTHGVDGSGLGDCNKHCKL